MQAGLEPELLPNLNGGT